MDGLFSLGHLFPGSAFNVGDVWNLRAGYLEYIVGFYDNIPVIDEAVVLVTITFLLLTTDEIEVEMGPTPVPCYPGPNGLPIGARESSGHASCQRFS